MGITVHYRGRIDDLERVEDFEDRVLDLVLELGGMAQVWRSTADTQPRRMVRGLIVDLTPGQEPTSLLISPEGWLIGLLEIEHAEREALSEPSWCSVKTQFGPLEGHVALVELLAGLKREFFSNLEVNDEAGYWETRNLNELAEKHSFVQQAVQGLSRGLQRHALSAEAAEDPEILRKRIERIAAQVHRTLKRPAEHPPVTFDDEPDFATDPDRTEAQWDEMFRHNRRQQERIHRALEERMQRGEDHETAFENSLRDIGLTVPGDEPILDEDDESGDAADSWLDDDPWEIEDEEADSGTPFDSQSEPDDLDAAIEREERHRHPLMQRAMDFMRRLHDLFRDAGPHGEQHLQVLFRGAGDLFGGLAQATSSRGEEEDEDRDDYGLRITQLKRALRGTAFALGALFPMRATLGDAIFDELHSALEQMERDVFQELGRLRAALRE